MAAQAQQRGAPRLAPEMAALLLGADQAQLEAQLHPAAQNADRAPEETGSGLRLDQAAAAFLALTSDRRTEILVGPAGLGEDADRRAGGPSMAAGGDGGCLRADHFPGGPQCLA